MSIRSVTIVAVLGEPDSSDTLVTYAIALAEREQARVEAIVAMPVLDLPTSHLLPMVQAAQSLVNEERDAKAKTVWDRIVVAARLAGTPLEGAVLCRSLADLRRHTVMRTHLSDLVLMQMPADVLSTGLALIEDVLFTSGRPLIIVPRDWTRADAPARIVVAWDGGGRAARAVGDAMPFLERCEEVEVVCITSSDDGASGADLAASLARHVRNVTATVLPKAPFQSDAEILRTHVALTKPDLLVMGAYGHSRLLEFVLGGVTRTMLREAPVPVLYSY